ncbi:RiPP maturation radical SAM protein 1 [Allosaccharopolyspora coralli]|uniref:RiPP maturation radical SAM protein 1 n=1 Tax=Allosaccharopolyspora coralli TaxID=2665642 RepID=A0A5Q3Q8R2_9PSEU|nr:RiPP maturation radical SAM C-methyltransferase [Allosaccharopolyspora coralli]QGK71061.1 RiPP maturation radical SAM protein 1 [Allosaccharopolyspora coralli]
MDVALVTMPWASVEYPSLACGILKTVALGNPYVDDVRVLDANLDFFDWAHDEADLDTAGYGHFALDSYFQGHGDWVFSSALYDDPHWRVAEFAPRCDDEDTLKLCLDLHRRVPDWIKEYARSCAPAPGEVFGFTTTFQQNTAALALAAELKRIEPQVVTVLGGANCDGPQGRAWHRNFRQIDYAVRGEGERSFDALLTAIGAATAVDDIPGLCWRDADGDSVANGMTSAPLPPASIVAPNFDGYFPRFAASRAATSIEPRLVVEGARGCWWGEKHHCTFCGLNGSFMQFRSKSPERFHDELLELVERYQILDLYLVDNILDMQHLRTVLPRLRDADLDLRVQCEIKSNLRHDQLRDLVDAGFVQVQPGIESLSSSVLRRMDKGVTGCQNVRMLRDASELGMTVMWNYLYGFPGESDVDHLAAAAQMPALAHLPPMDGADRVAIERFSPFFDDPALGFAERTPDPQYAITYDLSAAELDDLAYLFAAEPAGLTEPAERAVLDAIASWRTDHARSGLGWHRSDSGIVILGDRPGHGRTEQVLDDPFDRHLFHALDRPRTVDSLARECGAEHAKITDRLAEWTMSGLVYGDDGAHVHVVPRATGQQLLRIA